MGVKKDGFFVVCDKYQNLMQHCVISSLEYTRKLRFCLPLTSRVTRYLKCLLSLVIRLYVLCARNQDSSETVRSNRSVSCQFNNKQIHMRWLIFTLVNQRFCHFPSDSIVFKTGSQSNSATFSIAKFQQPYTFGSCRCAG